MAPGSQGMRKCNSAMSSPFVALEETIQIPWLEESLDDVKMMCKKVVPCWSQLPLDSLAVARVSGGITNILFSVTPLPPAQEDPVIVRIFGPMTEKVIDRKSELQAMQALSDGGFGAHLIGRFGNGVVQSFIRAHTLTTEEMSSERLIPLIARTLARFHGLSVPGPSEPQLWPTIHNYLQTARGLHFEDASKQAQLRGIDFDALAEDVRRVQDATEALHSPVVFSHNDLLAGNLMIEESTGILHVIDFEYSAQGFRGYDIANHFCEYAGFECDYSRYPDQELQTLFFRHYLNPAHPDKVASSDINALLVEVSVFALASHLWWALWALIQARYSPIEFDYLGYFWKRFTEFKRLKVSTLKLER